MVGHLNIDDLEIAEEDLQGGEINLSILLGNEKLFNMIKDSYQADDYLLKVIKYLKEEEEIPSEMKSAIKSIRCMMICCCISRLLLLNLWLVVKLLKKSFVHFIVKVMLVSRRSIGLSSLMFCTKIANHDNRNRQCL